MLRARRPVKARVSVVRRASALNSFARCSGEAFDSSQARKAVPICTALAPSRSAAAMPRPSAMPPAAITGTVTLSATCGTSASVPVRQCSGSARKDTRCPPASKPVATIMSTPASASSLASAGVVAVPTVAMPAAATALQHRWRRHAEHETEHRRFHLQQSFDLFLVARTKACRALRQRDAQFLEVRFQRLDRRPPLRVAELGIIAVAERDPEIQRERAGHARADPHGYVADSGAVEMMRAEGAEAAAFTHRHHQVHGRQPAAERTLHDRRLESEPPCDFIAFPHAGKGKL